MKLKHVIGGLGIVLLVAAWAALGIAFMLDVDRLAWTYLVVAAAVATEIFVWCMAAMLGMSIFDARRKIWRFLTSFGRSTPRDQ